MILFNCLEYKGFLRSVIETQPNGGHGQMRRIALHLKVHTTLISQIFNGPKHFTMEQACSIASYFGLTDLETDYFLTLVECERAGTTQLKKRLMVRLNEIKIKASNLDTRLSKDTVLSEQVKAQFYSNWQYSGIRLLTSVDGLDSVTAIAERLDLPKEFVAKVLDFLLGSGLVLSEGGRLKMGPSRTHLASDSPFLINHHRSWRLKNLSRAHLLGQDELMYTAPFTVSAEDSQKIRGEIVSLIEKVTDYVVKSPAEEGYCLGIDLCKF